MKTITPITGESVEALFKRCLFTEDELADCEDGSPPEGAIVVEGIKAKFGFHPDRVHGSKEEIRDFLNQMHPNFHKATGGGWTFLNLCSDKEDRLWTGLHAVVEQLVCLGIACGMAKYIMPRDMWDALPGSMPYIGFDTSIEGSDDEHSI